MTLDFEEFLDYAKSKAWLWLGVLLLLGLTVHLWATRPMHPPPGILAPDDPLQGPPSLSEPWDFKGNRFFDLATFELTARVLNRERYYLDSSAKLSPVDLALGWGPMSDTAVLEKIHISQSARFYLWSTSEPPIPLDKIALHSANMHIIPADAYQRSRLLDLRAGQLVHIRGHLVRIEGPGFRWTSSLTRQDTGDGACEVVFAEAVDPLS